MSDSIEGTEVPTFLGDQLQLALGLDDQFDGGIFDPEIVVDRVESVCVNPRIATETGVSRCFAEKRLSTPS